MAWGDWRYTEVRQAPKGRGTILGYAQDLPEGALRLLVNDDTDVPTGEAAEQFCRKYLSVKEGKGGGGCPTERPVHVHFTTSFDLTQRLVHGDLAQRFPFDGIIQDIIHDETGELTGLSNIQRIRQGILVPQPALLIVTNNAALAAQRRAERRIPNLFAVAKEPDPEHRPEPEAAEIVHFFGMAENNRDFSDDPLIGEYQNVVGHSTQALIREFLECLDDTEGDRTPIVIHGDSGTGKEAVARLIHLRDHLDDTGFERFQPVLVASIPPGTLHGELFGVTRLTPFEGTMESDKIRGYIEKAERGTLFIDEVGDLLPQVQGGLLRFLQDYKIHPVGGDWMEVRDVRCVFATNKDLRDRAAVSMRDDFLYRIDGLFLELPSLQERVEEHETLLDYFIARARAAEKAGRDDPFSDDLRETLIAMCRNGAFTGNLRQLQMLVKRIVLVSERGCQMGRRELERALRFGLMKPAVP